VRARSHGSAHTLMSVREHPQDERTDSGEFVGPDGSRATCCIAIVRALDLGHGHGTTDARRGYTCELAPAPLPAPPAAQTTTRRFLNLENQTSEPLNWNHQANLWFTCGSPVVYQRLSFGPNADAFSVVQVVLQVELVEPTGDLLKTRSLRSRVLVSAGFRWPQAGTPRSDALQEPAVAVEGAHSIVPPKREHARTRVDDVLRVVRRGKFAWAFRFSKNKQNPDQRRTCPDDYNRWRMLASATRKKHGASWFVEMIVR